MIIELRYSSWSVKEGETSHWDEQVDSNSTISRITTSTICLFNGSSYCSKKLRLTVNCAPLKSWQLTVNVILSFVAVGGGGGKIQKPSSREKNLIRKGFLQGWHIGIGRNEISADIAHIGKTDISVSVIIPADMYRPICNIGTMHGYLLRLGYRL